MKLLIVDDDKLIRETYQSVLSVSGYSVDVAHDLPTTELILKRSVPDYLLLDLMMRPQSGWEILEHLSKNQIWHKIPIIIFSGKVVYAHEIRRYGEQIMGYIKKPTRLPDIILEISRVNSCQNETFSSIKKAKVRGFSEEEKIELTHLLLTIPALEKLVSSLELNFRDYAKNKNNPETGSDPEMESLHSWIEGKKLRCAELKGQVEQ